MQICKKIISSKCGKLEMMLAHNLEYHPGQVRLDLPPSLPVNQTNTSSVAQDPPAQARAEAAKAAATTAEMAL